MHAPLSSLSTGHVTPSEVAVSSHLPAWGPFFAALLLYVFAVSVYDGYLVVRTRDEIRDFELNPVGLFLINCNDGDPSLFLIAKAIGTLFSLSLLCALNHRSERLARPVAFSLAMFQSGLLIFLQSC